MTRCRLSDVTRDGLTRQGGGACFSARPGTISTNLGVHSESVWHEEGSAVVGGGGGRHHVGAALTRVSHPFLCTPLPAPLANLPTPSPPAARDLDLALLLSPSRVRHLWLRRTACPHEVQEKSESFYSRRQSARIRPAGRAPLTQDGTHTALSSLQSGRLEKETCMALGPSGYPSWLCSSNHPPANEK